MVLICFVSIVSVCACACVRMGEESKGLHKKHRIKKEDGTLTIEYHKQKSQQSVCALPPSTYLFIY